ncbi:MAG: hypothetical protein WAK11_08515 [Candidatus Cybelea sp.]
MTDVCDRGELPLYRLYVMRAAYLLIGLWQGSRTWPAILHLTRPWDSFSGVFLGVVIVPLVLPWGYVWKHYVLSPGDRWR